MKVLCCHYCVSSRMLLLCMIISSASAFSFPRHSFLPSSPPSPRLFPYSSLFLSPPAVFQQPFGKEEDDSVVPDNIISSLSNYINLYSILSCVFCVSIVIVSNIPQCKIIYNDFVAFCDEKSNNFKKYGSTISGAIVISSIIITFGLMPNGLFVALLI